MTIQHALHCVYSHGLLYFFQSFLCEVLSTVTTIFDNIGFRKALDFTTVTLIIQLSVFP